MIGKCFHVRALTGEVVEVGVALRRHMQRSDLDIRDNLQGSQPAWLYFYSRNVKKQKTKKQNYLKKLLTVLENFGIR